MPQKMSFGPNRQYCGFLDGNRGQGEMMEGRGAGESCPTFPKMVPDDPMSEGKSKVSLVRRMPLLTAPACPSTGGKSIMGTPQDRS